LQQTRSALLDSKSIQKPGHFVPDAFANGLFKLFALNGHRSIPPL
jgi:hypothetical protein